MTTNCDDEIDLEAIQEQVNNPSNIGTEISYIDSENVPNIINAITSQTTNKSSKYSFANKSVSFKNADIDLNSVLKVKNNKNITNYTFNVYTNGLPKNVFYNVIVNESANGKVKEPYVLKYVVDEDALATFLNNNKDYSYFKGKRSMISFKKFMNSMSGLANKSNDCPPGQILIDNTKNTGLNGNFYNINSTNFVQTNPYDYTYDTEFELGQNVNTYINSYDTATGDSTSHEANVTMDTEIIVRTTTAPATAIPVDNNTNTFNVFLTSLSFTTTKTSGGLNCYFSIHRTFSNGTTSSETIPFDCPPTTKNPNLNKVSHQEKIEECIDPTVPEGEVGVNLADMAITALKSCIPEMSTGIDNLTVRNASILASFLEQNGCSVEAQSFAHMAIEAYNNDGEVDIINKVIIDSAFSKNPCLNQVYTDLGKASTFDNYLKNFDADFSVAHLKLLASKNLPSNVNARTYEPINYIITVEFNSNNLKRPPLDIARTMIHEIIHAEIFRKLLSLAKQGNIPWSESFIRNTKDDYPGLYDYYMRYEYNISAGTNPSSAQHEAMAQSYRGIIESVLREYDNTQSDETYSALAWTGLKNTVAYNSLIQDEKVDIDFYSEYFLSSNSNCE